MADNKNQQLNIEQAHDLLSPYLDDEVTTEERALVERALTSSTELRRDLERLRRTVALVAALPPVTAPRPFTLSETAVRPKPSVPKNWLGLPAWWAGWAALAATLLCVVVAGGVFWTRQFGGMLSPVPAAQIASAPEATIPAVEAQLDAASAKPAAQQAAPTPVTTEALIQEAAAPTGATNQSEVPALSSADQVTSATLPSTAAPTEGETFMAAGVEQKTAPEGTAQVEIEPAATTSPVPVTLSLAAPAPVEDKAAQTAGAPQKQAAAENGSDQLAAAQPPELRQEESVSPSLAAVAATPTTLGSTATPLSSSPTAIPTPLPSPTPVPRLTLQPPSPTPPAAPTVISRADSESPATFSWLIGLVITLVVIGLIIWWVSQSRKRGPL